MKRRNIKANAVLNIIRTSFTVLFPLITYPYATRVLGVENIGKVQFGLSIISYFSLLAALGVNGYGTRQGAFVRNDRKKFSQFASELFSINLLSTVVSYILLIILLFLPTSIAGYRELIFIQSLVIIFNTLSVDWVYSAQEDFLYITLRAIAVQIVSVVLLFVFIKQPDDYYLYALISTIATAGAGIVNFIHARKYCTIRLIKPNFKQHMKPILILFASGIATQIYINSDVVMLGLMDGDSSVGLYSVPVKVYTIIKSVLNATITVSIPRFAYYVANRDKRNLQQLSAKIVNTMIVLILPAIVLLFSLSTNIISFMAGAEYIESSTALRILAFALIFAVASNFLGNAILVSHKLEKRFLIATIIGAGLNILLNLFFIPLWQQNGAASTTVLAEVSVMIVCGVYSHGLYGTAKVKKNVAQAIAGCLGIVVIYFAVHILDLNYIFEMIIVGVASIVFYGGLLTALKNPTIGSIVKIILLKLKPLKPRNTRR